MFKMRLLILPLVCLAAAGISRTVFGVTANNGNLTLNDDGVFVYTPKPGFTGTDSFVYVINDGDSDSGGHEDVGTVTITVTGVIWFIDNSQVSNGDGRLGTPFNSIANF